MSHKVWRIATDTKNYDADDLSGKGAELTGGRWNEKGTPILYTASSRALACLETVVHLNAGGLPLNRHLVEIDIPDDIWAKARHDMPAALPVGWDAEPASRSSVNHGTTWANGAASLILLVPSVIVPEESNALINPRHPDIARVSARKVRKWLYDPRLLRS